MTRLTNKWIFLIINLLLSAVFYFLFSHVVSDLSGYINTLFYMTAFYLFTMLAMIVLKGRFLDGIVYGSRRFLNKISSAEDYLDEWKQHKLPSETVKKSLISTFFWQGFFLGIFMVILLFVYYK